MSFLFGCLHRHTSFPITMRPGTGQTRLHDTYIVCLDCGREFPYSWDEMRIVREAKHRVTRQREVAVAVRH